MFSAIFAIFGEKLAVLLKINVMGTTFFDKKRFS
jgi:hypothetical protein